MPRMERFREILTRPLDVEYMKQKSQEGWRLAAIEWERQTDGGATEEAPGLLEEVPYGLRVAGDCRHLEENPEEMQALKFMMELLIQDVSLQRMAEELNQRAFPTRDGTRWTPVAIFKAFPRMIEVSPRLFSTEEWAARRKQILHVIWNS